MRRRNLQDGEVDLGQKQQYHVIKVLHNEARNPPTEVYNYKRRVESSTVLTPNRDQL
jgi:hypothetical protein